MNHSSFQEIIHTIFDKRLYGFSFFLLSGPPLVMGLLIMGIIYNALNRMMLLFYVPLFILLVLISGLGSKNYVLRREVPNMGHFRGFLLLIASYLAVMTPFLINFPNDLIGSFQFLLIFGISTLALTIAVVEITIFGQRVALRDKMRLTNNFFDKQKKVWEKELEGFPNSENIISGINDGRFVVTLFDRGSFSLVVLWSCNVMEQIIDAAADGVISVDPKMDEFFKTDRGGSQNYPRQLKNLGYEFSDEDKTLGVETLWNILRNKVAHHNYRPTFNETYGALRILISFMDTMPTILQAWKNP